MANEEHVTVWDADRLANVTTTLKYERVEASSTTSIRKVSLYIAPNGDVTAKPLEYERARGYDWEWTYDD